MTSDLFQEPNIQNAIPSGRTAEELEGDYWAANGNQETPLDEVNEKLNILTSKIADLSEQTIALTTAVNQFGKMLDFMVQSVAQIGQSFKTQGIGGIMSMLTGGGKND